MSVIGKMFWNGCAWSLKICHITTAGGANNGRHYRVVWKYRLFWWQLVVTFGPYFRPGLGTIFKIPVTIFSWQGLCRPARPDGSPGARVPVGGHQRAGHQEQQAEGHPHHLIAQQLALLWEDMRRQNINCKVSLQKCSDNKEDWQIKEFLQQQKTRRGRLRW